MVLIDAQWFFGNNRERGIGYYLDYYFKHELQVPPEKRLWLVSASTPDKLINQLLENYGGKTLSFDFSIDKPRQQELLARWLSEKQVEAVFYSSPFERPWSLLDWQLLMEDFNLPSTAIVFDLIPQQFPNEVLKSWPEEDQKIYQKRLDLLSRVDNLLAISPFTKKQLTNLLNIPDEKIEVLKFGYSNNWLNPPREVDLKWWRSVAAPKLAVTISGGEWRKNLIGTLKYFAKHYAKHGYKLIVICRLGRLEQIKYKLTTWQLGVSKKVSFVGVVDERVKWRYLAQAQVFLFLSFAEGLGIPLFEAKKAKVPKIIISQELAEAGFDKLIGGSVAVTVAKPQDYQASQPRINLSFRGASLISGLISGVKNLLAQARG